MRKIKTYSSLILGFFAVIAFGVKTINALDPKIVITQLPSYINYQDFKLSYSAISVDPTSIQTQFYVMKEGGSYNAFGPVLTGASGQVDVNSGQLGESNKKYCFKAEIVSVAWSNETCTIFDVNGPDPVSDYRKEDKGGGTYRLLWRNPANEDFAHVIIYRANHIDFTAEGATEVATVLGSPDSDMTWEGSADPVYTYYFIIRAIDKAGNSSSLVGDAGTTTSGSVQGASTVTEGKVTSLPKEEVKGEVLSVETEESPRPSTIKETVAQNANNVLFFVTHRKKLTLLIVAGVVSAVLLIKYFIKKRNS